MSDPATLATTAVTYLVLFFTEAGKAVAKRVGDAATNKTVQLYDFLKTKLTSPGASEALAKLEKTPDEVDRQRLFRLTLEDVLADDPEFCKALAARLEAIAPETGRVAQTTKVLGNQNEVAQVSGAGNTVTMGRK